MELSIARLLSGLILLFMGRKMFWLFLAVLGFISGMTLGPMLFTDQSGPMLWLIAFLCGVVGILFAFFLQKLAIALGGFLSGGLLAMQFAESVQYDFSPWIAFLIGGFIGAILLSLLFDWALILLSSLVGSALLVSAFSLQGSIMLVAFFVLLLIGIAVQASLMGPPRRRVRA